MCCSLPLKTKIHIYIIFIHAPGLILFAKIQIIDDCLCFNQENCVMHIHLALGLTKKCSKKCSRPNPIYCFFKNKIDYVIMHTASILYQLYSGATELWARRRLNLSMATRGLFTSAQPLKITKHNASYSWPHKQIINALANYNPRSIKSLQKPFSAVS